MPPRRRPLPTRSRKFAKVMREFYDKTLRSSSGTRVTSPKQAKAIAASEARRPPKNRS